MAAALCWVLALAGASSAWAAGTEATTYTATETIPIPPASNFAGSGGGDGWSVALSPTQVFNVFHHESALTVACHNQSDASECWSPETITDGSGHNFATSGHPGMYLDQNTLKLYVYATRDDGTGGVVCIDTTLAATNPNPFCGFTALTPIGEAPINGDGISGLSQPMLFGNDLYAFNYVDGVPAGVGAQNEMLCFDVSTDAACAGQPFPVAIGLGTPSVQSFPSPAAGLIGSQLIVPITVNGTDELACLDASTHGNCGGSWPVALSFSYVSENGAPFPLLDGSGNITGLCLPTGTDQCFTLAGASTATPAGMTSVIPANDAWNGSAFVLGPRVYVPNGLPFGEVGEVECFDYSTSAGCANFPKEFSNLDFLYTVNSDPQRPTCIWVNADGGTAQIQNFDAFTGGACGQGPIRALASQFVGAGASCVPTSYNSLQVVTPARNTYTSGSVHFEDGDGNPIPGVADRPIDATGTVDLTGLSLNTSTGLPQFLITLNGTSGSPSNVDLKLSWTAPYDASCIDDDATAPNPAITASPSAVRATEGTQFTGAVATFNDPDTSGTASEYSATINWGDGSTSPGTISGSGGHFTVTGTHTFAEEGSPTITVTITDVDATSNSATAMSSGSVADAALSARGASATARVKFSGPVATFSDADPAGTVSDYTASINWGDGSKTAGTVHAQGTKFTVAGSHKYRKAGTFHVTVTITDKGGSTATARTRVTIFTPVGTAAVRGIHLTRGGCMASTSFALDVVGKRIASVTVTLDGKAIRVKVIRSRSTFVASVPLTPGAHLLSVKIAFLASSHTRTQKFTRMIVGCAVGPPRFTG